VRRASGELGLDEAAAADLLDSMLQYGLFSKDEPEPPPFSSAERLWVDLNWSDALTLHRATRNTIWRRDYPATAQVMTWTYHDRPVVPDSPRPVLHDPPADDAIALPPPSSTLDEQDVVTTMHKRRTTRDFSATAIDMTDLSTILHWCFRPIVPGPTRSFYTTQSSADGFRELQEPRPITVFALLAGPGTPSRATAAGTRVFRYSPDHHALVPLPDAGDWSALSDLMWGQDFSDGAPAMLVLALNWSQYMWKYRCSYAYRMAHLDLGSFMQTTLLVATALGLRTFVTPAIDDRRMADVLGTDESECAPSYVVALGRKQETSGS
jgi:SagB-type dehydrogenase family enzyme